MDVAVNATCKALSFDDPNKGPGWWPMASDLLMQLLGLVLHFDIRYTIRSNALCTLKTRNHSIEQRNAPPQSSASFPTKSHVPHTGDIESTGSKPNIRVPYQFGTRAVTRPSSHAYCVCLSTHSPAVGCFVWSLAAAAVNDNLPIRLCPGTSTPQLRAARFVCLSLNQLCPAQLVCSKGGGCSRRVKSTVGDGTGT